MNPYIDAENRLLDDSRAQREHVERPRGTDINTLASFNDSETKARIARRYERMKS